MPDSIRKLLIQSSVVVGATLCSVLLSPTAPAVIAGVIGGTASNILASLLEDAEGRIVERLTDRSNLESDDWIQAVGRAIAIVVRDYANYLSAKELSMVQSMLKQLAKAVERDGLDFADLASNNSNLPLSFRSDDSWAKSNQEIVHRHLLQSSTRQVERPPQTPSLPPAFPPVVETTKPCALPFPTAVPKGDRYPSRFARSISCSGSASFKQRGQSFTGCLP